MKIYNIFKSKYLICIAILIIVCLTSTYSSATTLKVGLYPWVPRLDQFEEVVTTAWKAQEPNILLEFVTWDGGYKEDPPKDLDVFVFDALSLTYFQASNFLSPIKDNEVRGLKDFVPYVIEGARIKGQLYGIPQLGCTNVLFYRKNDKALAKAKTIQDIFQIIGPCPYQGNIPPENVGMMVDLSSETTCASLYLETVQDLTGIYTPYPLLPPAAKADEHAIQNLQLILKMANKEHANWDPEKEPFKRAALFGAGKGRALIGFTEFMSAMGANVDQVAFKLISFGDKDNVPLFYTDIIGINATTVARGNRLHALKLANLLASAQVMVAISKPTKENESPQYLLPVRKSVFKMLGKEYPIYHVMQALLVNEKIRPRMFTMGPDARTWLKANKSAIHKAIFNTKVCPDDR